MVNLRYRRPTRSTSRLMTGSCGRMPRLPVR